MLVFSLLLQIKAELLGPLSVGAVTIRHGGDYTSRDSPGRPGLSFLRHAATRRDARLLFYKHACQPKPTLPCAENTFIQKALECFGTSTIYYIPSKQANSLL